MDASVAVRCFTAKEWTPRVFAAPTPGRSGSPLATRCQGSYSSGAITKLTMAITLMRMFMLGPDVSLNGSPTVSPTTVAA